MERKNIKSIDIVKMQNVLANNRKGTLIQCDLKSQLHFFAS